ncbi:MAG: tRNA pseudouridine(38-40) synthase TruA [Candidatus Omnitrophica bacterium]|nr:tRNA pseudouridine(38-40) synthase TruA [Candidatus Omnitrophota bacterium]
MRNFKLTLEYDGAGFCGWQVQPRQRTVQQHLEEQLEKIFKQKIRCIASGRTDSGVHALGQVVHFKVETAMKPAQIQKACNAFLDRDVAVLKVQEVPLDFHAQYSVKSKTYRYSILNRFYPSAFWRDRAYFYPHRLNLSWMGKAARDFKGKHDFKSFQAAALASPVKNTVRIITRLTIVKEGSFIHMTITANGFLYKMVRNMVGTLLAIGRGRIPKDSVPKLLKAKNRKLAPATAPSHGLCLVCVRY